jgi:hypothetical protein
MEEASERMTVLNGGNHQQQQQPQQQQHQSDHVANASFA